MIRVLRRVALFVSFVLALASGALALSPGAKVAILYGASTTQPALDLQFTSDASVDPRITYSGGAGGTYTDSAGVIRPQRGNWAKYSQDFTNAVWFQRVTEGSLTLADQIVAPNGTLTADKVYERATTGVHYVWQSAAHLSVNSLSVYAKAGERTKFKLYNDWGTGGVGTFDLSAVTAVASGGASNAAITAEGNGWYRCSVTINGSGNFSFSIGLLDASGNASYTGDGTSGLYVWGAMGDPSGVLHSYIPTTSAAVYAPRIDFDPVTHAPKGVLVEEQRTNLLLNSLIDGTSLSTQSVTTSATAYMLSFYGTGTVTLSGTAVAVVAGTGAYPTRTTYTFTPSAGTLTLTVAGTVQYANLEAGSFATSYIPTAASQVTRTADSLSMTGTNFSSWFNPAQGTFIWEHDSPLTAASHSISLSFGGGMSTDLYSNTSYSISNGSAALVAVLPSGNVYPGPHKLGYSFNSAGRSAIADGGVVVRDANASGVATSMYMGTATGGSSSINGHFKRLRYWRSANSDTFLQTGTLP